MVKQEKSTHITQSGKNCAIQGVHLIWKQKIWLVICKFLWSLTNQNAWFVSSFCTEFRMENFFMYIIRYQTSWAVEQAFQLLALRQSVNCTLIYYRPRNFLGKDKRRIPMRIPRGVKCRLRVLCNFSEEQKSGKIYPRMWDSRKRNGRGERACVYFFHSF